MTTETTPEQSNQTIVKAADFYPEEKLATTESKPELTIANEGKPEGAPAEGAKPEGEPKDEGKAGDSSTEIKVVAPENFVLDKSRLEDVMAFAKAHNLTSEAAQKVLNRENDLVSGILSAQEETHQKQVEQWARDVHADKELGGEKFKETAESARRVVEKFGDDGVIKLLNETGYGNNPVVVKLLARIGRAMADDKLVKSGVDSIPKEKPIEEIFYGKQSKE